MAPIATDWNPELRNFVRTLVVVAVAVYLLVRQLIRVYRKIRTALNGRS